MSLLPFRNGLVTVFNADSSVQTLCGRATMNLVPRGAQAIEDSLPVMTYFVVVHRQLNGTKGHYLVVVQLEAWAKESSGTAYSTIEGLMDRAEALFTGPGLSGQSIDVSRVKTNDRIDNTPEDGVWSIRSDFTFHYKA